MNRTTKTLAVAAVAALTLSACSGNDSDAVNRNISTEADNFKVARQIVFHNGITDEYLLSVEGFCQIERSGEGSPQVTTTCKTSGEGEPEMYMRHHMGLSDNVTYTVEQLDPINVSSDYYKVTYKPTAIIPDFENTSGDN